MDIVERKPKYKVGDIVTIKELEGGGTYRFGINDGMRALRGKSFKIAKIETGLSVGTIPDDGYKYILEGSRWNWASSMFEDSQSKAPTCITDGPSDKSIDVFIKRNKCPELDFRI